MRTHTMSRVLTATTLLLLTTPALAQTNAAPRPTTPTLEQTFRDIGGALAGPSTSMATTGSATSSTAGSAPAAPQPGILGGNNSSISRPLGLESLTTGLSLGEQAVTTAPLQVFTSPSPSATLSSTLTPGTLVQFGDVKDGFVQITPLQGPNAGTTVYAPEGVVRAGVFDTVKRTTEKLLEDAARVAVAIRDNPHVRLKGFRLNASITPTLELEFEMKEATGPTAAAAPR